MSNQGIRIQPDWDKAIMSVSCYFKYLLQFVAISVFIFYHFSEKDRSFWFHLYDSNKTHYQKVDINEDNLIPNTPNVGCSVSTSVV